MINDTLYLIQDKLNKKLQNLNIENLDKQRYDLLTEEIICEVNTIAPTLGLKSHNTTKNFNKNYLSITSLTNGSHFYIYADIEDNVLRNIEVSFLN